MKTRKALAVTMILMMLFSTSVTVFAQAGALKKVAGPAAKVLKKSPTPLGKLIAHAPEIIEAGERLLKFIATHSPPCPSPHPGAVLIGYILGAIFMTPDEYQPKPVTDPSIREFYNDAPLFNFDQP